MLQNKFSLFPVIILICPLGALAQGAPARSLITQSVDESKLTTLNGNTHALARAEFDRGPAAVDMSMERMLLVLKRAPEQEAALDKLLSEQQDPSSPNYHRWLSPAQFGQEFGPSHSDIQTITEWLESHGFQEMRVARGRDVIEFSGTAGQVEAAFHTEIHKYEVNEEGHWANTSDPRIPAALASAIAGVATLYDFAKQPQFHSFGLFKKSKVTGEVRPLSPELSYRGGCGLLSQWCYAIGPYDFAQIYNVLSEWNAPSSIDGSGQHIGIVARSDIALADVQNFRKMFGLPAKNPNIIVNGPDPGREVVMGDETESDLDVQWAGGVARNATIDFVTSKSTTTTDGVDLSAQYIVDNNLDSILTFSYALCETQMGSADLAFHKSLWQQASAEGITVLVASGDYGASMCENPNPSLIYAEQPGKTGLAVNGVASNPYDVAVGGTDFDDFNNWTPYFSSNNNSATGQSAVQYIPETAYNDSCTNAVLGQDGYSTSAELNCNDTYDLTYFIISIGGGGGASTVYTKPSWQTGPGVPADGQRDLPDVSMFAGDGTMVGSFYVVCQADVGGDCVVNNSSATFLGIGGTSASTQVFGAVMALVDQKSGGREGLPNQQLYALAAAQSADSCNSSSLLSSTCYFNDVTRGTIAMPCVTGSPNCVTNTKGDENGVLSGYAAGVGYDEATGLGSVNVANLVNATGWTSFNGNAADFTLTSNNSTVTVASQGATGTLALTVAAVNGYSGTFNLSPSMCSALPAETTCSFSPSSVTLNSQTTSSNVTVTFQTTAPSQLIPATRLKPPAARPIALLVVLSCLLAAALLLGKRRGGQRRWSMATAVLTFALLVSVASCGGGGGGGGGCGQGGPCTGGTPTGTTSGVVTLTDTNATPTTHSFVFTLTVN